MLTAVLVDDDQSNLSALYEKLTKHCPKVMVIAKCDSATEAIDVIHSKKPDLVFLDIEMPGMNGFVMLQHLAYKDFALIFVTAYDHYAIKAIKFSAHDYLVKPVDIEELKLAVEKAQISRGQRSSHLQLDLLLDQLHKQPKRITIPTSDGLQFIQIDDIIYLEATNNYTSFFTTANQKLLVCRTLKDYEDLLPQDAFIRIHHSYLINKKYVDKYIRGEGGQVVMRNGNLLDVSKRRKAEFLQAMEGQMKS